MSIGLQATKQLNNMAIQITGKIIALSAERVINTKDGEKKMWECVMQYDITSQYPKNVVFEVWKDDIFNTLATFYGNGETNVKVSLDVDAREYNGRWFNSVRAYKAELLQTQPQIGQPMYQQGYQQPPMGGYPQQQMQQGFTPPAQPQQVQQQIPYQQTGAGVNPSVGGQVQG